MLSLRILLSKLVILQVFCAKKYEDPDDVLYYFHSKYESMVFLEGATFRTGINDPSSRTGEYPVHNAHVRSFYIDRYPITNVQFRKFKQAKILYTTDAEDHNFSHVFGSLLTEVEMDKSDPEQGNEGWYKVVGAQWNRPEGQFTNIEDRMAHPVTHISHHDAFAYCSWTGKRLPTEHEWEYSARGGLDGVSYPWGDRYLKMKMNVWQGKYPNDNKKYDGWEGTSPVDAFPPQNDYGMYDMLGNVWEWTSSNYYDRVIERHTQPLRYVLKGGSFIDTRDGNYNLVVRTANRKGKAPEYTSSNIGFRCVMDLSEEELLARLHATTEPPKPVRIHRKSEMYYDEEGKIREKEIDEDYEYKHREL